MKPAILFLIVAMAFVVSCGDLGEPKRDTNPISPPSSLNYVPGRVAIGFVDSVNYAFIASFISGLSLEPLSIYADSSFSMFVQVDSGNVIYHLERLQQDSAVAWAQQTGFPPNGGDPMKHYLLVHFHGTVTFEYALALIRSIAGISWKSTLQTSRSALVKVEVGQEHQWIDSLKTYPFVRWADLDYIVQIWPD